MSTVHRPVPVSLGLSSTGGHFSQVWYGTGTPEPSKLNLHECLVDHLRLQNHTTVQAKRNAWKLLPQHVLANPTPLVSAEAMTHLFP